MHKFIPLFTCILFGCTSIPNEQRQSDSEIIHITNSILDGWHESASKGDFEKYINTMDSSSIFIGTDITENWTRKEFAAFAKPYFDHGSAWDFEPIKRNIYISKSKDVIWFDEVLNTWMGVCQGSGVMEKSGEDWKIKHYVLSIAVPNDNTREVINAKYKNDSLYFDSHDLLDKIPAQIKSER